MLGVNIVGENVDVLSCNCEVFCAKQFAQNMNIQKRSNALVMCHLFLTLQSYILFLIFANQGAKIIGIIGGVESDVICAELIFLTQNFMARHFVRFSQNREENHFKEKSAVEIRAGSLLNEARLASRVLQDGQTVRGSRRIIIEFSIFYPHPKLE